MHRLSQVRTAFSVVAFVRRIWPLLVGLLATLADAADAADGTRVLFAVFVAYESRQATAFIVAAILLVVMAVSTFKEGA